MAASLLLILIAALLPAARGFVAPGPNIRPWVALLEKGVAFEHKLINLSEKPPEFLEKYQRASGRAYGAGLVPLLEHGTELVIESAVVAEYVARNVEGVDGKGDGLAPKNAEDEELIDSFLGRWGRVTDAYYGLLTATSPEEVETRKQSYVQSLGGIDMLLQRRSGEYLLGSDFSYAECIAAPWIQRFYVTLPYFRGIDFDRDLLSDFERLSPWMGAVCRRPSCTESICPEEEMIAACKRYYVSYISPGATGSL